MASNRQTAATTTKTTTVVIPKKTQKILTITINETIIRVITKGERAETIIAAVVEKIGRTTADVRTQAIEWTDKKSVG